MSDPFRVVRQAHRICAAYYQQIFPLLNETAQKLETTFLHWDTWSFCKPPQKNKNPFETWKWDYLPIMDLSIVFSRQQVPGTPMSSKDFVLDFKLVTDSALCNEQRVEHYGDDEEPMAIHLKTSPDDAKSYLTVYIFSATTDDGIYTSPYNLWDSYSGYPEENATVYFSDQNRIKGIGYTFSLSEIAYDNSSELLISRINELLITLQKPTI